MMVKRSKFSRVPEDDKTAIINEYAKGEITQKELGIKHGFHYRQLAKWFKDEGRYDEYLSITKANQFKSAKKPMGRSKLKISGVNSISWKGRRLELKQGRISAIQVQMPEHPCSNAQGYVYQHRLIIEQELGRYLTDNELVHHLDLDPTNNDLSNLILLNSASEHGRLHSMLQIVLVELLNEDDLRNITEYLINRIRTDNDWVPAKKKCESKRGKGADD
jgi:hypothetical protein